MESDPGIRDVIHDIVLADGEVVETPGADAYGQEGPLTTFFHPGRSRAPMDLQSERVGSSNTTEIRRIIRRHPPVLRAVPAGGDERAFGITAG